jgi:hypothetical protein
MMKGVISSCLFLFLMSAVAAAQKGDASSQCIDCHSEVTPRIVSDWKLSKHS